MKLNLWRKNSWKSDDDSDLRRYNRISIIILAIEFKVKEDVLGTEWEGGQECVAYRSNLMDYAWHGNAEEVERVRNGIKENRFITFEARMIHYWSAAFGYI